MAFVQRIFNWADDLDTESGAVSRGSRLPFTEAIPLIDANVCIVEGCITGVCESQIWTSLQTGYVPGDDNGAAEPISRGYTEGLG